MREVDLYVLDNIPDKSTSAWDLSFKQELVDTIKKYNNSSAPGSDYCGNHLSQRQMITQVVNLLSRISSGKFTRELDKEPLLN